MLDISIWRYVLQRSKSRSATGACGFAVKDLKALPDLAIQHLALLCDRAVRFGFPDFLIQGRVNTLAKVDSPQGYNDGRPICVLSTIYRWWSSVFCTQLLKFWAHRMPPCIVGGLPGRAARDVTFSLQQAVELSHLAQEPLSGFVLDIVKCFNALPRKPREKLLTHLGCPSVLAESWIRSLGKLQRASSFCGNISEGHCSTTGAPEGDAICVAACIAVGWLLSQVLEMFGVRPALFVDNWSWSAEDPELNGFALQELLSVTSALKLTVDWTKSFAWARDKDSASWWKSTGVCFLPPHVGLRLLPAAKDLGTAMRYRGAKVLGCVKQRLAEGLRRWAALKFLPRPLQNKAYLTQTSEWPATFYGTEAHCISIKHVATLRTAACRALMGGHSHTNPFLALSVWRQASRTRNSFTSLTCFADTTCRRHVVRAWQLQALAPYVIIKGCCRGSLSGLGA